MKMDMDLIRDILIEIRDDNIDQEKFDDRILYHIELLLQRRYVEGIEVIYSESGNIFFKNNSIRLTWDGQEFVETIRPKKVWEKIKQYLSDKGVELTIDAIKMAAPTVIDNIVAKS